MRSSHDKRIDLFEVGEASTARPARCATARVGHGKKVTVTACVPSRRDSDLQINQRRQSNFDWVSFTSGCTGQDFFLRSPRDFEASAYSAAMTAPPDLGSVREARVLRDSRQRFDRATLTSLPLIIVALSLKFVEPFVPVRAEKRPPSVARRSK